ALAHRGYDLAEIGFPNYDGFFGKLVARFLNGEFGPLDSVDPHFAALLYAGDRLESKSTLESALAAGKLLISDRYVASNLAHQGSRVPSGGREEFLAWLRRLEYAIYGLPVEDLVVYLRVPVDDAHRLIGSKRTRGYTDKTHDIQEADFAHLEAASRVYDQLSRQSHWVRIECFDAAASALRSPASIHEEILSAVDARIAAALRAQG
ncbi:MAG: thymidylate kinase, partial [Acidobacteriota bacterium]|nr:thymidylate kinase [Acidobacteriota bacterium]